ncbi:MAG: hypothetical protein JKY82_06630 [Rhizobiaceae bacterium]|nr:hypothetical protein [Rhizobiaceae bacterium]
MRLTLGLSKVWAGVITVLFLSIVISPSVSVSAEKPDMVFYIVHANVYRKTELIREFVKSRDLNAYVINIDSEQSVHDYTSHSKLDDLNKLNFQYNRFIKALEFKGAGREAKPLKWNDLRNVTSNIKRRAIEHYDANYQSINRKHELRIDIIYLAGQPPIGHRLSPHEKIICGGNKPVSIGYGADRARDSWKHILALGGKIGGGVKLTIMPKIILHQERSLFSSDGVPTSWYVRDIANFLISMGLVDHQDTSTDIAQIKIENSDYVGIGCKENSEVTISYDLEKMSDMLKACNNKIETPAKLPPICVADGGSATPRMDIYDIFTNKKKETVLPKTQIAPSQLKSKKQQGQKISKLALPAPQPIPKTKLKSKLKPKPKVPEKVAEPPRIIPKAEVKVEPKNKPKIITPKAPTLPVIVPKRTPNGAYLTASARERSGGVIEVSGVAPNPNRGSGFKAIATATKGVGVKILAVAAGKQVDIGAFSNASNRITRRSRSLKDGMLLDIYALFTTVTEQCDKTRILTVGTDVNVFGNDIQEGQKLSFHFGPAPCEPVVKLIGKVKLK